jgi:hypothetical protein
LKIITIISPKATATESRPASTGSQMLRPLKEAAELEDKEEVEAAELEEDPQDNAEAKKQNKNNANDKDNQEGEDDLYCPVQIVIGENKEEVKDF